MQCKIAGALAFALMIAACGGEEPETRNAAAAPASAPDYGQLLAAMAEGQRNAVFIRAIRDAGLECQHVERSTSGAPIQGHPSWNAECSSGLAWTLVIGSNGIAQIVSPQEAAAAAGADADR